MADGLLDPSSGEVITPRQAQNSEIKREEPGQKSQPSFKLDLSKCHTETDIAEVAIDIDKDITLLQSHRKNSET